MRPPASSTIHIDASSQEQGPCGGDGFLERRDRSIQLLLVQSGIERGTLADGLRIESDASRAYARQLTPEVLAARRAGVQDRGRQQSR